MDTNHLIFPEIIQFTPRVHEDARGFFFESFNVRTFTKITGLTPNFVQDNHSRSHKGILRGLHYQLPPHAQGKLVRVVHGEVFDVVVDIRRSSPRFGQWLGTTLSAENKKQLWIPPGFAHGFVTLTEEAEFLYKTTDFYDQESERCILWNDPVLNIDWRYPGTPMVSAKDAKGSPFQIADVFE